MVRGPTERRRRAHERARQDILLAAAEVLAERGPESVTLADVAQAAGYAAPSLYRYFESKEEIHRELEALLVGELIATFQRPVDRAAPLPARLEALVTAQLELVLNRRALVVVLLSSGELPRGCVSRQHAGVELVVRELSGWLRRNATRAELRAPPDIAARAIAGLLHAFFPFGAEAGDEPAAQARTVVDLALHGVTRARAGQAPGRHGDQS